MIRNCLFYFAVFFFQCKSRIIVLFSWLCVHASRVRDVWHMFKSDALYTRCARTQRLIRKRLLESLSGCTLFYFFFYFFGRAHFIFPVFRCRMFGLGTVGRVYRLESNKFYTFYWSLRHIKNMFQRLMAHYQ